MHVDADQILVSLADRQVGDRGHLVAGLREIWDSVSGDLTGEEAAAVLWSVAPLSVVVGSSEHAAARTRLARALYPSLSPASAVSRFRTVLRRPAVTSTVAALRAEESAHVVGERARVRAELWSLAVSAAPEGAEPKDVNAHNANRLRALQAIVALDQLAEPAAPIAASTSLDAARDRLKKKLDAVVGIVHKRATEG